MIRARTTAVYNVRFETDARIGALNAVRDAHVPRALFVRDCTRLLTDPKSRFAPMP
jgi:hypothetical protein